MMTDQLLADKAFFDELINLRVFHSRHPERIIEATQLLAYFCCRCHVGLFTSSAINDAIRLASELIVEEPTPSTEQKASAACLFLATHLYNTGGHTRLLETIAAFEKEQGSRIDLLITSQAKNEIPNRINLNGDTFDQIESLAEMPITNRVNTIRQRSQQYSKIYCVLHPYDAIPFVALDPINRPEIIYVNHADHVFWIGAAFSDTILNIRPFATTLSVHRRNSVASQLTIPVRLNLIRSQYTRASARMELSMPDDACVFLTISNKTKVAPNETYNIFDIIDQLLHKYDSALYLFVGINEENYIELTGHKPPPRLKLLGPVEDPEKYKAAADIYLEGMPWNSLTALLESVYAGAYPILQWGPAYLNMNMETDLTLSGIISHPKTMDEYFTRIDEAVHSKSLRDYVVNQIQVRLENYNSSEFWRVAIETPVSTARRSEFKEFATEQYDLELSQSLHAVLQSEQTDLHYFTLRNGLQLFTLKEFTHLYNKYVWKGNFYSWKAKVQLFFGLLYRKYIKKIEFKL